MEMPFLCEALTSVSTSEDRQTWRTGRVSHLYRFDDVLSPYWL